MEIYKVLQGLMTEKNLSIPDVARACNLSDSTVRGIIVRKQKSVALEVAFKLAAGLNVSLEFLNGEVEKCQTTAAECKFSEIEKNVIKKYRYLNESGKKKIDEQLDDMMTMEKYTLTEHHSPHIPDTQQIRKGAEAFAEYANKNLKTPVKK